MESCVPLDNQNQHTCCNTYACSRSHANGMVRHCSFFFLDPILHLGGSALHTLHGIRCSWPLRQGMCTDHGFPSSTRTMFLQLAHRLGCYHKCCHNPMQCYKAQSWMFPHWHCRALDHDFLFGSNALPLTLICSKEEMCFFMKNFCTINKNISSFLLTRFINLHSCVVKTFSVFKGFK
jgi:hypothetical protein